MRTELAGALGIERSATPSTRQAFANMGGEVIRSHAYKHQVGGQIAEVATRHSPPATRV